MVILGEAVNTAFATQKEYLLRKVEVGKQRSLNRLKFEHARPAGTATLKPWNSEDDGKPW